MIVLATTVLLIAAVVWLLWFPDPGDRSFASLTPPASLILLDRSGATLRVCPSSDGLYCQPVGIDRVSPWLVLATVAVEDRRFLFHPGVDWKAVGRAFWQNARAGRIVSGGSTLTQQLVRSLQPRARSWRGKIREMIGALRMEQVRSKEDILKAYFNNVPYGHQIRGAESAAWKYFGVPCADLTLAQAAALAGIPKSPAKYDLCRDLPAVTERQRQILARMLAAGWIDGETYASAVAEPLSVLPEGHPFKAPHFTEYVLARSAGAQGTLTTTLDLSLQEDLEKLLTQHLERLRSHHVTNGAVLVLDNATGAVLAWVGSRDFFDADGQGQVDAVIALRQPGSSVKPFTYALAFASGKTPSDLLDDLPTITADGFMPRNYDETYHGRVRMREALACSYNVAAVRLAMEMGPDRILRTMREFGFASLDRPVEDYGAGIVLGNGEVTLLELTAAYAALARGGVWLPARFLPGEPEEGRRVLDPESAYLVTDVLSDNMARAEAFGLHSPLLLPFPMAVKTGTTKDYRDNWTVGYTPEWTIGVWVGNFDGRPMRKVSGVTGAAPFLHDAAMRLYRQAVSGEFQRPAGVREAIVCPVSGELKSRYCPDGMLELFREGVLPPKGCSVHGGRGRQALNAELTIAFPGGNETFKINPNAARASQAIRFRSSLGADARNMEWRVDGKKIRSDGGYGWWTLVPGGHVVVCIIRDGSRNLRSPAVRFTVLE